MKIWVELTRIVLSIVVLNGNEPVMFDEKISDWLTKDPWTLELTRNEL